MGRLIDTSDLNNQIMLHKDRFGSLSVPICNIFEDMIRDTPTAKSDKPSGKCNKCKYYEGVHNVQGHAPCSYHNIGGVLWNWYCSQFEEQGENT